eukprot:441146-Prymnesium_polylepis.1
MARNNLAGLLGVVSGFLLGALLFRVEKRVLVRKSSDAAAAGPAAARAPQEPQHNADVAQRPFDLDSKSGLRDAIASVASSEEL